MCQNIGFQYDSQYDSILIQEKYGSEKPCILAYFTQFEKNKDDSWHTQEQFSFNKVYLYENSTNLEN